VADTAPLLATGRFGSLVPVNDAARNAMKAVNGIQCRIEIKKSGANQRRRAFYWLMLDAAATALTDMTGQPWDSDLLHDELKRRLKLGVEFTTPSGVKVFKARSTSNREMTEPERAHWTDRCAHVLSTWIGCTMNELMDEARRRNGEAA
jgi:uncharacterized membrane protein YccC